MSRLVIYVMKHHIVPASAPISTTLGGGMKHSRLKSHVFNWKLQCEKAYKHQLYRAIHLARTNPDYQIKHPNECRENPDKKILTKCHPEAESRILKDHEKILKTSIVPIVDRPKRLSRV